MNKTILRSTLSAIVLSASLLAGTQAVTAAHKDGELHGQVVMK